jgi:hypothetical protein
MKRLSILFLVIIFSFWILPLGVFIKPAQEKSACGGERAICMCHVSFQASAAAGPGISLKSVPSHNGENTSGGNYFVGVKPIINPGLQLSSRFTDGHFAYRSPFLVALEYPPKF